jgi:hypothetical protein
MEQGKRGSEMPKNTCVLGVKSRCCREDEIFFAIGQDPNYQWIKVKGKYCRSRFRVGPK